MLALLESSEEVQFRQGVQAVRRAYRPEGILMTTAIEHAQRNALKEWLTAVWTAAGSLRRDVLNHCLNDRNLRRWWPRVSEPYREQLMIDMERKYEHNIVREGME